MQHIHHALEPVLDDLLVREDVQFFRAKHIETQFREHQDLAQLLMALGTLAGEVRDRCLDAVMSSCGVFVLDGYPEVRKPEMNPAFYSIRRPHWNLSRLEQKAESRC